MSSRVRMLSAIACLCLAAFGATSEALAEPGKIQISTRSKMVEVKDEAWGITAFTMQIPDNWTFEGALLRDPYCGGQPTVAYRISSPDGLAGFQSLPTFVWHWSDDRSYLATYRRAHCKTMEPMTPTEFLKYVAPAIRPSPTLGAIMPTVDAAQLDAMIAQYNDRARAAHVPGSDSGGGVHSRIQYKFHGQLIEENLRVVVQTFSSPIGMYGGPRHVAWNAAADVSAARAPKGQLDEVMRRIGPLVGKAGFTNEWMQRQARKMANDDRQAKEMIRRQGAETAAMLKRNHDVYMKQSQERFERSQQIDRERTDAMHRSAVAWTLYAGDEQLVRNPSTGELSRITNQHGANAHQDAVSGGIVTSDDPNFDPSYYLRGSWTQLENVDALAK